MASANQTASYERMLRLVKSTGLYRLDGNSAVEKELSLYSAYFGTLEDQIERMVDNCFVDSISRDGFDTYRLLYSLPEDISIPDLRDVVRKRLAITNRDFTADGIRRCMESGGFAVTLTEDLQAKKVTIHVLSDKNTFGTLVEKNDFLKQCLPCHVQAVIVWDS